MARLHMPLLILCSLLMLVAPASADRDGRGHDDDDHKQDWEGEFLPPDLPPGAEEFRVVPLRRAVEIALARFDGRVIAARLTGPLPGERDRGVVLVQELRLLTPDRDVLRIRLDARTGAFLDVAGRGLAKARKKGNRL
ncbi:PepSY domain-containing protein [Paracoccus sp. (in: a-proteobacteria)]|uniref:PepSY domain-containing protein n=1 Tax=Paracoccus sp. TaxID=267 RepID=UPI0035B497F4